MNNLQNNTLTE